MRALPAAALAAAALAGCSGPAPDPVAIRVEIETLVRKYHDAYDGAEVQQVLDLLDPEVQISIPPDGFLYGKDACAAQLEKDMNRIREQARVGKRKTYFTTIRTVVEGPVAVATYVAIVREEKSQANLLFTRVFRKSEAGWRILAEHYSVEPLTP